MATTKEILYEKHSPEGKNSGNSHNGKSRKTLKGKQGETSIGQKLCLQDQLHGAGF
jgi:hypothetical protein